MDGAAQVFEGGNNYGSGDSSGDNPDQIIDKLLKLLEQEETIPAEEILQLVQEARTAFEDKVFLGDYRGDNLHRLGNRLTVLG